MRTAAHARGVGLWTTINVAKKSATNLRVQVLIDRMVTAIARTIPRTNASISGFGAMSSSWRPVDEPDFREEDRARCMSFLTLARIEAWAVAQIDRLAAWRTKPRKRLDRRPGRP